VKHEPKKRTESPSRKEKLFSSLSFHDAVFIATLSLSVPWGLYFLYQIYSHVQKRALDHPDKVLPKPSDFLESTVYIVVFIVLRLSLAEKVFSAFGNKVLPNKWDAETRFHKVDRFGVVLFKFCFFLFISVYGYLLLSDKEWVPPILGGKGEIWKCFPGSFPMMIELDPGIKTYYLLQLGYHTHSFLFQFRMSHRADFYEMVLHHVVTLFLICFSYLTNFTRVGSLVFFHPRLF